MSDKSTKMSEQMYRINWSSGTETGHGEYCLSHEIAVAWLTHLRVEYPNMRHWVETM
jgi:hypothetical protein